MKHQTAQLSSRMFFGEQQEDRKPHRSLFLKTKKNMIKQG
jgi:hypothetical protein